VVDTVVVLEALEKLTAAHRDVLVQLYFRGHSVAETADALGIPPGTVKSRSYHAVRALREVFGGTQVGLKAVAG
jgi:RNA polymerase sigma-70 factor (ECF subfamily)